MYRIRTKSSVGDGKGIETPDSTPDRSKLRGDGDHSCVESFVIQDW